MRRIGPAIVLAVSLTLAPLAAGAQQTEKGPPNRVPLGYEPEFRGRRRPLSADSPVHPATVRHQSRTGHQPVGGPVPESPCKLKGLSHT
jgi:hypothetical protein